jgi:hypothetical protein
MKIPEPEPLFCCGRDSTYGRLLRRIDQALDVARTRQWMTGQAPALTELELSGLSEQDARILWRIIDTLDNEPCLPRYLDWPAPNGTECETNHH